MIIHGRIGKHKAWEIVLFSNHYTGPAAFEISRNKWDHKGWNLFISFPNLIIIEIGWYDTRHYDEI